VYATCHEPLCVAHFAAGSAQKAAQHIALMNKYQHLIRRQVAARLNARARSKLTPDLIREIQQSGEQGRTLARRLGISETRVSKVRLHGSPAHEPLGGLFSGLMRRAA